MPYTDIISLSQARTYLRIDDTQNDTDAEITQMINTALSYLENRTNHILIPRDIVYYINESYGQNYNSYQNSYVTNVNYKSRCQYVYDFPINSIVDPIVPEVDNIESTVRQLYTIYNVFDSDIESITLNVGYVDPADVPEELIQAGLYLIKLMYYETESEKTLSEQLPIWVKEIIKVKRRFIM